MWIDETKQMSAEGLADRERTRRAYLDAWAARGAASPFNRSKGLSAVLKKAADVMIAHPDFVRQLPMAGETQFRFVLHHKDDMEREVILILLVFEVPA